MRINEISVKGLFGCHDYVIPLFNEKRITIIHAPNGYGKTTMLKLLNYVVNGDLLNILSIEFKEFKIKFDNSMELLVLKKDEDLGILEMVNQGSSAAQNTDFTQDGIIYKITKNDGETREYIPRFNLNEQDIIGFVNYEIPHLRYLGGFRWIDRTTKETIGIKELIVRYRNVIPITMNFEDESNFLDEIRRNITIKYIGADRLFVTSNSPNTSRYNSPSGKRDMVVPSVKMYSDEIVRTIREYLMKYSSTAQELDRTFPNRLIREMKDTNPDNIYSEAAIYEKLKELENKRIKLEEVGLVRKREPISREIGEMDLALQKVLTLYIKDTHEKLQVFDYLEKRISMMQEIINSKFNNKYLKISKDKGFTFLSSNGHLINSDLLSSGEQHEVVLTYEMLFKSKENSMVMIDEPEISLHILWQQNFLGDMIKISELAGVDLLIATHSPDIISDYWDLTVALGGDNQ